MKSLAYFFIILSVFSADFANAKGEDKTCSTTFRPKTDETAFAAVGSSLKIADKTCIKSFLDIKHDTISGAITIPQGLYPVLSNEDEKITFDITSKNGAKVSSCAFCDPVKALVINKFNPKTLCVLTALNLESCAIDNSIAYEVKSTEDLTEGLCAPSLVYFGRQGDILHFAINDCSNITKPTLSYDLSLGDEIRFLNEQIKIIKADNLGIYYSRLSEPSRKNNETLKENELTIPEKKNNNNNQLVELAQNNNN